MVPHTIDPRADTGVNNVTMGMWLFLASETMLFGALFSAYALLRTAAATWPHGPETLNLTLGGVNTLVLLAAGLRMRTALVRPRPSAAVVAASLAALVFLGVKSFEWHGEITRGLVPATSTFFALYFTLTGLHALHVIGGIAANVWILAGTRRQSEAMTRNRIRAVGLYWVFIDVVWLVIFVLMYLS
jgi:cytochrome c oxidase subunit 3